MITKVIIFLNLCFIISGCLQSESLTTQLQSLPQLKDESVQNTHLDISVNGLPLTESSKNLISLTFSSSKTKFVKIKYGLASTTLCSDPNFYNQTISVSQIFDVDLNSISDGVIKLCILKGISSSSFESAVQATELTWSKFSIVDFSISRYHSCFIKAPEGKVFCQGHNTFGQLGNKSKNNAQSAVEVHSLSQALGLATSSDSTCAIKADRTVACWGRNSSGQLGIASATTEVLFPTNINSVTLSQVKKISSFSETSAFCAMTDGGVVKCWGQGANGRLGTSSTANVSAPVQVVGFDGENLKAVDIAVGQSSACAVTDAGLVKCWGAGSDYRLGRNLLTDSLVPADVIDTNTLNPLDNVKSIKSTYNGYCAILQNNSVKCWGGNNSGKFGTGSNVAHFFMATEITNIPYVEDLAAGTNHLCYVTLGGSVACSGFNGSGLIGNYSFNSTSSLANGNNPFFGIRKVWSSYETMCGLKINGEMICWGNNNFGLYGSNKKSQIVDPKEVQISLNKTAVVFSSNSNNYRCAVDNSVDKEVYCWGTGGLQFGNNSSGILFYKTPQKLDNLRLIKQITLGNQFGFAIDQNDKVYAWGSGGFGQLGHGSKSNLTVSPQEVSLLQGSKKIVAGTFHACAILADNSVSCWGDNMCSSSGASGCGQLGVEGVSGTTSPIQTGLTQITDIASGQYTTCAVKNDGLVYCWGLGNEGSLGSGNSNSTSQPSMVSGLTGAVQITSTARHFCARLSSGLVKCWGRGTSGQLGDGSFATKNLPVAVTVSTTLAQMTSATDITSANAVSCAYASVDGVSGIYCWGDNEAGLVSTTSVLSTNRAQLRIQTTDFEKFSTQGDLNSHICYIRHSDKKLLCFGLNSTGALDPLADYAGLGL